jgi:ankyrin repeat protein
VKEKEEGEGKGRCVGRLRKKCAGINFCSRINVNLQDKEGYTALCYAAIHGDLSTIKKLVDAKADWKEGNEVDGKIRTPMYYAKAKGHEAALQYFQEIGMFFLACFATPIFVQNLI